MTARIAIAASLSAVAWMPVQAQQTNGSGTANPVAASTAPAAPGDIIVTAQRRPERLREVPLTITSITGDKLAKAGVTTLRDLQTVVSGLTFSGLGTVSQPAIRGVTSTVGVAGAENPNALYIDGVYQLNPVALNESLPDVANIEVLKGPQGTLFGRNATGGAILVTTKAPSFTPTGTISLDSSYYVGAGSSRPSPRLNGQAFLSGPLIDDLLAASISGGYDWTAGYLTDDATGRNTGVIKKVNARGKLLLTPAAGAKITLSGFYVRDRDQGLLAATPIDGLSAAAFFDGSVVPSQPWHVAYDPGFFDAHLKQYGGNLNAKFDIGIGDLTAITAWQKTRATNTNSIASARGAAACVESFTCIDFSFATFDREFSQELNLASRKFGIFQVTAGLFYFNARGGTTGNVQASLVPGGVQVQDFRFRTRSYAGYAELTANITPELAAIAGVRYNSDAHHDASLPTPGDPETIRIAKTFNSTTPRFSLRYAITPRLNVYATYSKGFKSGLTGVSNIASDFAPVAPEKLTSYEVGVKYGHGPLSFDGSFFYYDYQNKQEQTFTGTTTVVENTGPVRIYGMDFDASIRLDPAFTVSGNLSWIPEAKYRDFPNASGQSTVFDPACGGFCPGAGGTVSPTFDASGLRLLRTPKLTGNLTLAYQHESRLGLVDASATIAYSSAVKHDITGMVRQSAYATLNVQAGIHIPEGLRIGIFGRNLTNKAYIVNGLTGAGSFNAGYAPPAEVGMSVSYAF